MLNTMDSLSTTSHLRRSCGIICERTNKRTFLGINLFFTPTTSRFYQLTQAWERAKPHQYGNDVVSLDAGWGQYGRGTHLFSTHILSFCPDNTQQGQKHSYSESQAMYGAQTRGGIKTFHGRLGVIHSRINIMLGIANPFGGLFILARFIDAERYFKLQWGTNLEDITFNYFIFQFRRKILKCSFVRGCFVWKARN